MSSPSLVRLMEIAPPPGSAKHTRGDRDAARAAVGWAVPDHVFEVIETYGGIAWMQWMLLHSPFTPHGIRALTDRAAYLQAVAPGKKSLIATSDPDGALLFAEDDGTISVSSSRGVAQTKKTLSEVLASWLGGGETWGLFSPAELTEASDIPPFALPIWDEARPAQIAWAFVKGGAKKRAARWDAIRSALGPHVHCARVSSGETQQDRVYLDGLELELFYDSYNAQGGMEQIHLRHYLDRKPEVKALFDRVLAAAGMTLVKVEGLRGMVAW